MPCYRFTLKDGSKGFICGDLGEHCTSCSEVSDFLCDYPVGDDKTCDLHLCASHAYEVGINLHYCPAHFQMWLKFTESGAANKILENVESFRAYAFQSKLNKRDQNDD